VKLLVLVVSLTFTAACRPRGGPSTEPGPNPPAAGGTGGRADARDSNAAMEPTDANGPGGRDATPALDTRPGPADGADAASPPLEGGAPGPFAAAPVFDLGMLHTIDIRVDDQYLARLDVDKEARVPCTVVYDGTILASAGIRKKGGNGSWRPLSEKPAFSIKFNEFVKGQKLLGLSKLLLNNAVQDPSFLHEHVTYELARIAGAAAPLTAHGLLTFNGKPYGLYVVREAMNDDFLRRSFGKDNEDGNLYEGGEFIGSPHSPELKDEQEEMRSRADIQEVARLVSTTPDDQWLALVGEKLDIPSFLTGYAVESLIDHWDGYFFGPHNYYVYHHPGLDRFVFLLAGADSVLGRVREPGLDPKVLLAKKFLQFPETRAKLAATLKAIVAGMDAGAMEARLDQAARVIHTHKPTDARFTTELGSFDANLPMVKTAVRRIKAWTVPTL